MRRGEVMVDASVLQEKVRLYFESPGGDVVHATELYHEDAAVEFPQSSERFEGSSCLHPVAKPVPRAGQFPRASRHDQARLGSRGTFG